MFMGSLLFKPSPMAPTIASSSYFKDFVVVVKSYVLSSLGSQCRVMMYFLAL